MTEPRCGFLSGRLGSLSFVFLFSSSFLQPPNGAFGLFVVSYLDHNGKKVMLSVAVFIDVTVVLIFQSVSVHGRL